MGTAKIIYAESQVIQELTFPDVRAEPFVWKSEDAQATVIKTPGSDSDPQIGVNVKNSSQTSFHCPCTPPVANANGCERHEAYANHSRGPDGL